ncbi:hypothetical protein PRJ_1142 [Pseudomonas sp. XWY-1]|nr:hypothetical protein PRJ_1142 [Pseudomonas sp. XWY-1]
MQFAIPATCLKYEVSSPISSSSVDQDKFIERVELVSYHSVEA